MTPRSAKPPKADARKVVYEKVKTKMFEGEGAMTVSQAKKLLGWEQETEKKKFGGDFLITDVKGLKIRCHNNVTNRFIYGNVLDKLQQEHLRRRWRLNGETIIIGKTGLLLNGQHTLISLVLASQEWQKNREHWGEFWSAEPTMEKLVVFGISEEDETVNTMDTCKPRSLTDVIGRSGYFSDMARGPRKVAARMTDYAIRLLWHRTGVSLDAFAPRQTHAECLDFIARHERILETVKHIYEENGDEKRIQGYVSPGYASGLMYLMAASKTDYAKYSAKDGRNEDSIDWKYWNKASDFWVLLAGNTEETRAVRTSLGKMVDKDGGSQSERWALLVKAWNQYAVGQPITEKSITLKYGKDEDGYPYIDECPTVGGIDIGDPNEVDEEEVDSVDPTPEEIQERATTERKARKAKAAKALAAETAKATAAEAKKEKERARAPAKQDRKTTHKGKAGGSRVGKLMWITPSEGEPYQGKVLRVQGKNTRIKISQGHKGAGNTVSVPTASLTAKQPRPAGAPTDAEE